MSQEPESLSGEGSVDVLASWVDAVEHLRRQIADASLMHGWIPPMVQIAAAILVVCGTALLASRWWKRRLPWAVSFGVVVAMSVHWFVGSAGLTGEPAPALLWAWIALAGSAGGVVVVGWRGARWRWRATAVLATSSCLLSAALVLNEWVGYVPTVYSAWNQLTAGSLPNQTNRADVMAMQLAGVMPAHGVVVPVTIGAETSKFRHRGELVYLPPAWFARTPPPELPVVLMVGAEINTPADWLRIGGAASTADAFAAAHGGNAPVLVFVDSGGAFGNDTECVNGSRGNAADYLTNDVPPFIASSFGVSQDSAHWGVAGFSTGGTCAVDLTVMHPELFSAFVDIAGDVGPNAGTKEQTITRLFGGNAAAWAAFDPTTVITRHGPYHGVAGWFAVAPSTDRDANAGRHDWGFAASAFAAALPWLSGQLGTPGVPRISLPRRDPTRAHESGSGSTVHVAGT
jgi:S-formylglutathione hydrolase FrmB